MADFTLWDRATLEQFAKEATEKMVADWAAIDELVRFIDNYIEPDCGCLLCRDAEKLIRKHTQRKEAS